mmetsp:Transcript_10181/g.30201  ORF Transcript_10181/g.30201 Transcript_10181/m.30201 type:complete len:223 (+) Transcript_10181:234-902(+)
MDTWLPDGPLRKLRLLLAPLLGARLAEMAELAHRAALAAILEDEGARLAQPNEVTPGADRGVVPGLGLEGGRRRRDQLTLVGRHRLMDQLILLPSVRRADLGCDLGIRQRRHGARQWRALPRQRALVVQHRVRAGRAGLGRRAALALEDAPRHRGAVAEGVLGVARCRSQPRARVLVQDVSAENRAGLQRRLTSPAQPVHPRVHGSRRPGTAQRGRDAGNLT